jgi:hypothetical protein
MIKVLRAMLSVEGENQYFLCDAIELEGRIWLVPKWQQSPGEQFSRPVRIILLTFQHQRNPSGEPFDVIVNVPIPKGLLEGRVPPELAHTVVVHENPPDIRIWPTH